MPQDIDRESFGFVATDLAKLIRTEFDRLIAQSGLGVTPGEARLLAHASRTGPVRQNVLAERMGVEAMTVTGFLDRLEAKQLIRRIVDPVDRRAKLVEVTPTAAAVLAKITALGADIRKTASIGLSNDDWERFMAVLTAARKNLADQKAAGPRQSSAA